MKFKNKHKNHNSDDDFEDYIEDTKKWFEQVPVVPEKFPPATEQLIIELKEEAKKCLESETANYKIKNAKTNSNYQWMKSVMTKGTVSDKIASHTVMIQNDPVHNLELLRSFVGMVKVGKKKECIGVMDALTDLFLEDLLLPNRKLQAFHQKPLTLLNNLSSGNAVSRRKILSVWYFEDQLKEIYDTYIEALNTAAHDSVDNNKEKAITGLFKLLSGNPEQEKKLLAFLVNKLGDPSQKVASKTIYCLGQLIRKHPNMQGVILNEVEKLLFRSNVSTKAQYYSLCYLSQFYLSHEEHEVAKRLINVYFGFFKACVKKGEIDSRMMSALLIGVNRAYPYAKLEEKVISEHLDTIYKIVHLANFNVSLQALCLLYQVSDFTNNVADRYYSALYRKLLDPKIIATSHQAMLLNLIYKSLLKDTEQNRVKAIIKRLLQLCLHLNTSFTCGILYLISQLLNKKKGLLSTIQKATLSVLDEDDDGEEKYNDVKVDAEIEVKDEILSDVENEHINIKKNVSNEKEEIFDLNASVEIVDCKDPEIKTETDEEGSKKSRGWYHLNMNVKKEKNTSEYNPLVRNPLFAGAEHAAFVELHYLRQHFHPTVSLYAMNILNGQLIKYQGDPLKDFTLVRFLDRFVFKNPKQTDEFQSGSHPTFGKRKFYRPKGVKSLSVTSSEYLRTREDNIPVDEKFLHMYLQKKYSNRSLKDEDESDVDSVASDEFEEMLEKMTGTQKEDMDFMEDIGDRLKKNKSKARNEDADDESADEDDSEEELMDEDDEDIEDDENDDLMEEGDEDLLKDLDDDDDEEIMFSDDELKDKTKKNSKKNKKNESVFAPAEEFAELLEDEGSSYGKPGSSNTLSNNDKSHKKQMMWEMKRNNNWSTGKKRKRNNPNKNNKNKRFKK
ncbi:CCAAT/enhancer-binding protein zeta [Coccinella septempunctata]|uniref:CCAAT/enhancer-binding protein zeta n=1 Tax=Coccinella septempunctata TaxID=41139 RepID=UPI001D06B6E2|nr:CCAAT/enhancer-binding protein zeta [Coccinella septempunctata]